MANKKIYVIVLYMFAFNLLMVAMNSSDVWGSSDMDYMEIDTTNLNASINEITSVNDIEASSDRTNSLSLFEIPGMLIKSVLLIAYAFGMIPLVGVLLFTYHIPLTICAIFEGINILLLALLWGEFASNRSVSK